MTIHLPSHRKKNTTASEIPFSLAGTILLGFCYKNWHRLKCTAALFTSETFVLCMYAPFHYHQSTSIQSITLHNTIGSCNDVQIICFKLLFPTSLLRSLWSPTINLKHAELMYANWYACNQWSTQTCKVHSPDTIQRPTIRRRNVFQSVVADHKTRVTGCKVLKVHIHNTSSSTAVQTRISQNVRPLRPSLLAYYFTEPKNWSHKTLESQHTLRRFVNLDKSHLSLISSLGRHRKIHFLATWNNTMCTLLPDSCVRLVTVSIHSVRHNKQCECVFGRG